MSFTLPAHPMDMGLETVFSGNPLDRADQIRGHDDKVADLYVSPSSRLMVVRQDDLQVLTDEDGSLVWLSMIDLLPNDHAPRMLLGLDDKKRAHLAVIAPEEFDPSLFGFTYRDLRGCAMKGTMSPKDLAIAAHAKAILDWHLRHQYCAVCGTKTKPSLSGHERVCPSCGAHHYPRTDPVVIMLAVHGDKALVGRGYGLPPGIYTALAGFMEPGERIEEAVARELYEEVGLTVTGVQYVASQPWPWQSSLMIGCLAEVDGTEITRDETEIEDAFWITKEDAQKAIAREHPDFNIPPKLAIARQLIEVWVE